jgi:hypothetical protein
VWAKLLGFRVITAVVQITLGLLVLALAVICAFDDHGAVSDSWRANIAWRQELAGRFRWLRASAPGERQFRSFLIGTRVVYLLVLLGIGGSLLARGIISVSR